MSRQERDGSVILHCAFSRSARLVWLLSLSTVGSLGASAGSDLNLYEWMSVSKIVVLGTVASDDQRFVGLRIDRCFRGDLTPSSTALLDVRTANRNREAGQSVLRMEAGRSYLVLLEPRSSRRSQGPVVYGLVRGIHGVREAPKEGSAALAGAVARLAQVQADADDRSRWRAIEKMLEEPNPFLVRTALELLVKFQRGEGEFARVVRPILDHPRSDIRASAALLIGQILGKPDAVEPEERAELIGDLAGRARRDSAVEVRVAATNAIAQASSERATELLREIARDDPDQAVRYAAERALYERSATRDRGPRSRRD